MFKLVLLCAVLCWMTYHPSQCQASSVSSLYQQIPQQIVGQKVRNICCLPRVFSTTSLISHVTNNSSIKASSISVQYNVDYVNGRYREDTIGNFQNPSSLYKFQVGDDLISYTLSQGNCNCAVAPNTKLERLCIPQTGKISTVSIIGVKSFQLSSGDENQFNMWIVPEPNAEKDACWILSSQIVEPASSRQTNSFNMFYWVDPNVFMLPAICPPFSQCLGK